MCVCLCVLDGGCREGKRGGARRENMEMWKENNHALCFPLLTFLFLSLFLRLSSFSCSRGFYCYYHGSAIRELYVLLHWSIKWRGPHSSFLLILSSLIPPSGPHSTPVTPPLGFSCFFCHYCFTFPFPILFSFILFAYFLDLFTCFFSPSNVFSFISSHDRLLSSSHNTHLMSVSSFVTH